MVIILIVAGVVSGFLGKVTETVATIAIVILFTALAFMQIGQTLGLRASHTSLRSLGLLSNPVLLRLVLVTFLLQLVVLYIPFFDEFFNIVPLSLTDLLLCVGLGVVTLVLIEAKKGWKK